jgi:hypothetical protein
MFDPSSILMAHLGSLQNAFRPRQVAADSDALRSAAIWSAADCGYEIINRIWLWQSAITTPLL